MKNVLIVDVDPEKLKIISDVIENKTTMCQVYTAQDGIDAVDIINTFDLHLVITSLEIPGVDGFELLAFLSSEHPKIKVIVMTSTKSKMVKAQIIDMGGAVVSGGKPDLSTLTKRIFTELQIDSGGKVQGISLPSFLQMMELEGKTCTLSIVSGNKKGFLYFFNGNLIAAKNGKMNGKDAALEIIGWDQVVIEIDYSRCNIKQELKIPLMSLLLESRRMLDEKQNKGVQKRAHERYECLVSVDYDIDDWAYQSYIKNISIGGAFIEMNHPVKMGEEIVLTFTSDDPPRICNITGTVVRRDGKGIGVKFSELSLLQKDMIDMIIKNKEGA